MTTSNWRSGTSRLLRLGLAAVLAAAGCAGAGVQPLAVAGRSDMGRLELDGVGVEIAAEPAQDEMSEMGSFHVGLTYLPMKNQHTGEKVDVYLSDAMALARVPIIPSCYPNLHARVGLGPSLLYMDREDGGDMAGFGLCARAAVGCLLGENAYLEVYGSARGWLGRDAEHSRTAWSAGLGVALGVRF